MEHPIKRPTYDEHIMHMFTPADAGCMSWALDLTSYGGVKADASKIAEWIASGRMPPPDTGRKWSAEKLQTFRNWSSNTGFAERKMIRLQKPTGSRIRKNIQEIENGSEELTLLKKAFTGLMARDVDKDDPTSFFNLAGLHWLPGPKTYTYCRHHDDAYNPWHRAYLIAFEDALRSVEGCENVTLPYWDILGDELPGWVYELPFHKYPLPYKFTNLDGTETYDTSYETERNSAATIVSNVAGNSNNIAVKIGEALSAKKWNDYNGWSEWPQQHEGIIRAHDNGHGECGATIANQDIAAFDPLFWFFHCNWDRLWWKWQTAHKTMTVPSLKAVVTSDTHWLEEVPESLLAPFDVNSAEMVDLSMWRIDYEHPPESPVVFDELIMASKGKIMAENEFRIATTERFSVRVKDINRLDIPGSFDIVLYSGKKVIDQTHIFQPSTPRDCENCSKHGVFSADFIVNKEDLSPDGTIRVAIETRNRAGNKEEFPLFKAGNPTVNIRLLLHSG